MMKSERARLVARIAELEQDLRTAKRLAWLTMEHAPIGIALVSLDGRFLRVNRALSDFLGRTPAELDRRSVHEVSDPDDALHHADLLSRTIDRQLSGYRLEMRFRRGDGCAVWGDVAVALIPDDAGGPLHCIVEIVDVTQRKVDEEGLRRQALLDPLTGVANRAGLERTIEHAQQVAAVTGTGVGLIFVDLDRFKPVNDRFGHAVGDEVLRTVACRLQAALRPGDAVARVGGDEFVIVCGRISGAATTTAVLCRLRDALRRPMICGGHCIEIDASFGIHVMDWEEAASAGITRADEAMYAAKRKSANKIVDLRTPHRAAAPLPASDRSGVSPVGPAMGSAIRSGAIETA